MKKTGVMLVVFLMVLSTCIMPVFGLEGSINSISYNNTIYTNNSGTLSFQIQSTAMKPYIVDAEAFSLSSSIVPTNSGNNGYTQRFTNQYEFILCQPIVIMVRLANNTTSNLNISQGYYSFSVTTAVNNSSTYITPDAYGNDVQLIGGTLSEAITSFGTTGNIQLRWSSKFSYNSGLVIPAKSVLYDQLVYYKYSFYDTPYSPDNYPNIADLKISSMNLISPDSTKVYEITDFSLMNADYNSIEQIELLDDIYNQIALLYQSNHYDLTNIYTRNHTDLQQIHEDLQEILNAYTSNASNVTETQSNISSTDDLVSDLHDQELTYYQQNESALNNVGLSNFSFDSDQSSGLGAVVNDFTTLWNNIGPLQIIFTFTLSMSLATYLLRHRPITNAIKKNEKK